MKMVTRQPSEANAPLAAEGTGTFEGSASFPLRHRLHRLAWVIVWSLFASWTPPALHRWRVSLINLFGGKVHPACAVYGSARIWYPPNLKMARSACLGPRVNCYSMAAIELGEFVVISQGAFLCTGTHDINQADFQIAARPIRIDANAWIAANAFVGPGVHVGEGAVLGATGATFRDLEEWAVYLGNPANKIRNRIKFYRR